MAALATAVGFVRLFGGADPAWLVRGGASCLIVLGLLILVTAFSRHRPTTQSIEDQDIGVLSSTALGAGTPHLAVAALTASAAVWQL